MKKQKAILEAHLSLPCSWLFLLKLNPFRSNNNCHILSFGNIHLEVHMIVTRRATLGWSTDLEMSCRKQKECITFQTDM